MGLHSTSYVFPLTRSARHRHGATFAGILQSRDQFHYIQFTNTCLGITTSWHMLERVVSELGFKRARFVHYVVDNSESEQDCMYHLLTRFVHFYNENPGVDWNAILLCLYEVPFEPKQMEYEKIFPLALRLLVAEFLEDVGPDHKHYDPFDKNAKGNPESSLPSLDRVPPLRLGNTEVDIEVVRTDVNQRSKELALNECTDRFHKFRNNTIGFMASM